MSPKAIQVTGEEVLERSAHDDSEEREDCYGHLRCLQCNITLELSRADRGSREPVLRQTSELSTQPRYGVGLNELLGAKDVKSNEQRRLCRKTKRETPGAPAQPLLPCRTKRACRHANNAHHAVEKPVTTPERALQHHRRRNEPVNQPKSMPAEAEKSYRSGNLTAECFLPPNA
jgi:hypothetical protein